MKNKVYTLEEYNKKYRHRRTKLLEISKSQLGDYQKKYPDAVKDYLLKNKKWTLIGDTYYQIPRFPSFTWFRNLNLALQIGTCVVGAGVVAGITVGVMYGTQPKINYITYTLDSDVILKKNPNYDIEVVEGTDLPGKTIAHKDRTKKDFKVLAFTDTHFDHYQTTCNYTFSMLARNIMKAEPDLVVFAGDNITSSYNAPRTRQFAQLLEDLGVYWCATLGNHEKNRTNPNCIPRDTMINIWADKNKYPHCLIDNSTKKTEEGNTVWGIGNSLVNLASNEGVTQSLYFLDSGTEMTADQMKEYAKEIEQYKALGKCSAKEVDFYDYIKDSQVTWYKETFSKTRSLVAKEGKKLPHSTIISHVPLIEQEDGYLKLFNDWEDERSIGKSGISSKDKIRAFSDYPQDKAKEIHDLYSEQNGYLKGKNLRRREDLCYGPHDLRYKNAGVHTPIFSAMQSFGDNNVFFCGHDHQNNYTIKWDGQFLGYLQPACYSSNNLLTMGMLGKDIYYRDTADKYRNYLIQGCTYLNYKNVGENNTSNIIDSIEYKTNYEMYDKDSYKKIIDIVKDQYLKYKHKEYKDNHASYLIDDIV